MKATRKRIGGQAGYILLGVMLVVTLMLVIMTIAVPRIAQQIKREREEDLVNRGKEYAMAIKRFVHKTGRYPASIEQLEDTNHIRFLRKRFKDPMTADGEWRLVHPGEAQINFTLPAGANPGLPGSGNPGLQGGNNGLQGNGPGQPSGSNGLSNGPNSGLSPGSNPGSNPPAGTQTDPNQQAGARQGSAAQLGSLSVENIGNGQTAGGGPFIGVASTSKATAIKEFNGQTTYDGWLFVYEPRAEQTGGTGILVAAPRGTAPATGSASGSQGSSGTSTGPGPGGSPTPGPIPQ
jgi:type II secretory pathway pseudopilin PulG